MKSTQELLKNKTFKTCNKAIYEFQDLCLELEKTYGKAIWSIPCRVGVTNSKLREAAKIAKERGKETLPYLLGIIKRL